MKSSFSERVKTERERAGLSQTRLARMCNLSGPMISCLERGKSAGSEKVLSLVARALGVRPEWLRSGSGKREADWSDDLVPFPRAAPQPFPERLRQLRKDAGLSQRQLGLASKNREIDFYDSDSMGKRGTLYREAGDGWKGDRHTLLYVRADLLRRYLTDTRQVLVWCNWGERDWLKKMEGHDVIRDPARQRIYQAHDHIHRSFSQWSAKDSKVV